MSRWAAVHPYLSEKSLSPAVWFLCFMRAGPFCLGSAGRRSRGVRPRWGGRAGCFWTRHVSAALEFQVLHQADFRSVVTVHHRFLGQGEKSFLRRAGGFFLLRELRQERALVFGVEFEELPAGALFARTVERCQSFAPSLLDLRLRVRPAEVNAVADARPSRGGRDVGRAAAAA